jgi:uncharacterized protein (DUF2062 family)
VISRAKEKIRYLLALNNTPQEIALGVSLGIFIGITFPYGLHTFVAILISLLIPKTNKIAIIGGTYVSIPPTVPFIVWAGYEIGRLILHKSYPALSWPYIRQMDYRMVLELYYPVFVGSLILGVFSAGLGYLVAFKFAQAIKNKRGRP